MPSLRLTRFLLYFSLLLLAGFPGKVFGQLTADFSANNTTGCLRVVTTFTDLSSGTPASWTWNFYRNNLLIDTRTSQNPGKIFTQPGCYDVELIVADASGNTDTLRRNCYIEVFQNPAPAFTSSDTIACAPATIQFTNLTVPNAAGLDSCTWVFRNQTTLSSFSSTDPNPLITLTDTGFYDVQLRCTNSNGCDTTILISGYLRILPTPAASFTVTGGLDCAFPVALAVTNTSQTNGATGISYQWAFPGGTPPLFTGPNPPNILYNAAGNYPLVLRVSSAAGCADTFSVIRPVSIQTLNVGFTINDTTPCAGQTLTFTDTTRIAGATRIWDFGDGSPPATQNPANHTYAAAGGYTVKLLVTSPQGCTDSTTRTFSTLPQPPVDFGVSPTITCDLNTVFSFSDSSGTATSWLWNFGDNSTSTQQNPTHSYNLPGIYTVCLRVTDVNGCFNDTCKQNILTISTPVADFVTDVDRGCVPFVANLRDTSTSIDSITSRLWIFGNGTGTDISPGTSTQRNPSVTINSPGFYSVTLIIQTINGCTDTLTRQAYFQGGSIPNASFTIDEDTLCINQTVTFTSDSTQPTYTYFWDKDYPSAFIQGGAIFRTTYMDTGCFTVALRIEDRGCQDSAILQNALCVFPPKAQFQMPVTSACATPATLAVSDASIGPITSYQWFFNNLLVSTSPAFSQLNLPANLPPGTYPFSLVVENTLTGCQDTFGTDIVVANPVADFQINNKAGCKNHRVVFSNLSLNTSQYLWNFGDGSQGSVVLNPAHTYTDTGFFSVTLIATDANTGCSDTLTKVDSIRVDGPYPDFGGTNLTGCAPLTTSFLDSSVTSGGASILSWSWDFGDTQNNTSPLQNPSHQYLSGGFYSVKLRVTDSNGCTDSITKPNFVQVVQPIPDFVPDADTTCLGATSVFTNLSTGGNLSYLWIFGPLPTDTSTQVNPSWTFPDTGFHRVILIATDPSGCIDTLIRDSAVYVENLMVDFDATPRVGVCPPLDVRFTSQITGLVDSVIWFFGDNTTSNQLNPRHIYSLPGCFDVTLIAFHERGCVDTLTKPCFIDIAGPSASLSFQPTEPCLGDTVTFTVLTDSASTVFLDTDDGPLLQFSFGQNVTDTVTFSYVYGSAGLFTPIVVVENTRGCQVGLPPSGNILVHSLPAADFIPSDFTGCAPFTVNFTDNTTPGDTSIRSWTWSFGTLDSAFVQNPTYTYQNVGIYTATLVVEDEFGCVGEVSKTMEANPSPIANFSASDSFSCAPATIDFTDLSTNGIINQWLWDFGDGDSATGTGMPRHTYTQNGLYDVTLIVTDLNGCSDTLSKSQYIHLRTPTAYVYPQDPAGCAPASITLYADSAALRSDTTLASYTWSIRTAGGNLRVVSGPAGSAADSLVQPYATPGRYDFSLIVTDVFGCEDTLQDTLSIYAPPQAALTVSDPNGCAPHSVSFGDSSLAGDSSIVGWLWDFGNGDSAFVQHPPYTFPDPGTYSVKLLVVDANGCSDMDSLAVEVFDHPVADFTASDTFNCAPIDISFTDLSSNTPVVDWKWYFGDGDSALGTPSPTHRYLADGRYDVTLIATNANGCSDTLTRPAYVHLRHPQAYVYANDPVGCNPITITLFADSSRLLSDTTLVSFVWIVETSTGVNPPVTTTTDTFNQEYQVPGIYDVSLVVTDVFGCMDTISRDDYIVINETTVPDPMEIQYVSVIGRNQVEVVYDQWPDPVGFRQYLIYWRNPATGTYEALDSISDITQTRFVHQANNLDPEARPHCYKVIIQNSCLQYGDLDATSEHCTVSLSSSRGIDQIRLDWTAYVGWTPLAYEVYRVGDYDPANTTLLATVPGNQFFFEDNETFCYDSIYYRVRALQDLGGSIASWSDRDGNSPIHLKPSETVDMTFASVFADSVVDLAWGSYAGYRPTRYILDRSLDKRTWTNLDTFPLSVQIFQDPNVTVDEQSYAYRISVLDTCGDVSPFGLIGKTILLEAETEGKFPRLSWTPYEDWGNGVLKYEIEVFNPDLGAFEYVSVVPGNVHSFIDDATFLQEGEYCYRIKATEANGAGAEAYSNVDCAVFSPKIFAPNAFSPNSDGYNDYFTVQVPNARTATLQVFSRWGKLLYSTSDLSEGWDGRYQGQDVPEGVYVFTVRGEGADGTQIELSGSVTLIR